MNRRLVSAQFRNVFVLLDELRGRAPADMDDAFELLRYEITCARDVSIGSCISGSGVAPEVLRALINDADVGAARSYLEARLLFALCDYSPFEVAPQKAAALLTRLLVTTPPGTLVDGAAELAMFRYCGLLEQDECSLDAQYIEIIIRESLGLHGDAPDREFDVAMRHREAQAFLNHLSGLAALAPHMPFVA